MQDGGQEQGSGAGRSAKEISALKYVLLGMLLCVAEWQTGLALGYEVEPVRMVLTAMLPCVLEWVKQMMIERGWPARLAKNMLFPLMVEMVRYILIIVALMLLTSMLSKEKSLYAILFCVNFFVVIIVNTIVNLEKNKQ